MPSSVQTLATTTEFDGTAGKGLVTFSDLNLPPDRSTRAYCQAITAGLDATIRAWRLLAG